MLAFDRRPLAALTLMVALSLVRPSCAQAQVGSFPFRFDGRILMPVRVGGSEPLDIILDTGLGSGILMLMHLETGEELGLDYVRTVAGARGAGSGANKDLHLTAGEDLSLAGIDLGRIAAAVMDEHRADSDFHNVGVLGAPLFIQYVVQIDFENRLITLFDPETFEPDPGWEEVPLEFGKNIPIMQTSVDIDGQGPLPVRLLVDTGGKPPLALVLDPDRGLAPGGSTVYTLSGTGLRGDVFAQHGRVAALKVGSHTLDGVIAGFWTGDEAPALEEMDVDGVLSLGTLYHFDLIFDYNHRRMFLRPNRFASDPFELNMAGFHPEESPFGKMVVHHVMEDSEAARKGLRKGDVITQVDGREASEYGYLELKRLFERDGATVTVTVERDGGPEVVILHLKRIL